MTEYPQLTDLEQLLLLSVLRLRDGAYGAGIQADVETVAERHVSLGSIHMTLSRLAERGLVCSRKGAPLRMRGGRARRLYSVTPAGRVALERSKQVLERMWAGVPAEGRP